MHKCPKCGETELFQFTYDHSKTHRPIVNILCNNCGEQFPPVLKLPKQELTLEEAAEYFAHNYFDMHETNNYKALKQGFEKGAKWFEKGVKWRKEPGKDTADYIDKNLVQSLVEVSKLKMYSEEEVYNLLEQSIRDNYTWELQEHYSGDYRNLKDWFKEHKKK
jgi:hypothetical protein